MTLNNPSTLLAIGTVVTGAAPSEMLITDADGVLQATNTPTVKKISTGIDYTNGDGVQGTFILPNGVSFVAIDKDGGVYPIILTDVNNTLAFKLPFPSGDMVFGLGHVSNVAGAIILQLAGAQVGTLAGPSSPYYPPGLSLANGYGIAPLTIGYREVSSAAAQTDVDVVINCTSGTFAVTLLSVVGRTGVNARMLIIKNSGVGTITLTPNGLETVGVSSLAAGATARLVAGSAGWVSV